MELDVLQATIDRLQNDIDTLRAARAIILRHQSAPGERLVVVPPKGEPEVREVVSVPCVHHWVAGSPAGGMTVMQCAICGKVREVADPDDKGVFVRQRRTGTDASGG